MLTTWACIVEAMYLALATLVLAAEKTGIKRILTLDSDFYFYRIASKESFQIVEV